MGQTTSTPSPAGGGGAGGAKVAKRSRAAALATTGRYAVFEVPSAVGVTGFLASGSEGTPAAAAPPVKVHLLGAFPCATVSEEEAYDLVSSTEPAAVYVDVHPETLSVLEGEVRAGRVGAAYHPPETPSPVQWYTGAALFASIRIRHLLVDNELLAYFGAEPLGAYKAALLAAISRGAAGSSAAAAAAPPVRLLSFPYRIDYNNYEVVERPSHLSVMPVGNNAAFSNRVTALIGLPSKVQYAKAPPEVEYPVTIPDVGYFTRPQVSALQDGFRVAVNRALLSSTADTLDVERDFEALEAEAGAAGDFNTQAIWQQQHAKSQAQSQAIAYVLQEAARSSPPGSNVVAVVNAGSLASLKRNWAEARPPADVIPPLNPALIASGYVFQGAALSLLAYGAYRAFRRFPKTTVLVGGVVGVTVGMAAMNVVYSENMLTGPYVRAALARPRVTAGVGRV
jgi:hypothetical protein